MDFNKYLPYLDFLKKGGLPGMLEDWQNPAKSGMPFLEGAAGKMQPYFDPYIQEGMNQIPGLNEQYGKLVNDPGQFINQMGQGYQKSPGFDFALKEALGSKDREASRGGMFGTPQHEQWQMETATGMANQDYNNWLTKALGAYNTGLGGMGNMYGMGGQMAGDFGNSIGNMELQKALMAYLGRDAENKHSGGMIGNMLGALGGFLGG